MAVEGVEGVDEAAGAEEDSAAVESVAAAGAHLEIWEQEPPVPGQVVVKAGSVVQELAAGQDGAPRQQVPVAAPEAGVDPARLEDVAAEWAVLASAATDSRHPAAGSSIVFSVCPQTADYTIRVPQASALATSASGAI